MVHPSWTQDWNDIIRDVIFADEELKSLMEIPEGTSIIDFIDKYFIEAGYTNKILSDENVRIVYGSISVATNHPNVSSNRLSFDIYVKHEEMHNVGRDRLMLRTKLIASRLINLLTKKKYIGNYRFFSPTESNMGTSAIGYNRYNMTLSYLKTY